MDRFSPSFILYLLLCWGKKYGRCEEKGTNDFVLSKVISYYLEFQYYYFKDVCLFNIDRS